MAQRSIHCFENFRLDRTGLSLIFENERVKEVKRFDGNNKTLNRDYFDLDRFVALSPFEIEFEISLDAGYRL